MTDSAVLSSAAESGTTRAGSPTARERALAAAQVASENRGRDVVVLDLRKLTPIFDYFVLVTGSSRRQLHAISEEIDRVLCDEHHETRQGIEGYVESRWILLDYGDVVIHLFDQEARDYYLLEQLWCEAPRVPLPLTLGETASPA